MQHYRLIQVLQLQYIDLFGELQKYKQTVIS